MPQDMTFTPDPVLADRGIIMPDHFPDAQARALLKGPIEQMGRSQAARLSGLHRLTVGRWLDGHVCLGLENRLRLAEICGYTVGVTVTLTDLGPSMGHRKHRGPLNPK